MKDPELEVVVVEDHDSAKVARLVSESTKTVYIGRKVSGNFSTIWT